MKRGVYEREDDVVRLQELLDRTGGHRRDREPVGREIYGSSPFGWGEDIVYMRIDPTSMWAYAFHPENFPE